MNNIFIRIKGLWSLLVGESSRFPLENRLFNTVCIIALFAFAYHVPFNYLIGLPYSALISLILLIVQFYMYYLSRFKNKLNVGIVVSGIMVYALFGFNYFVNSGIAGPTLLLFSTAFFLILAIAPPKQYKWWFFGNLFIVSTLLTTEFYFPDSIQQNYISRFENFVDVTSAYMVITVLIFAGTSLLVAGYRKEKLAVQEKALQLERLNFEKNKLFSIVSHDLRSPLSSIQTYLELLVDIDLDVKERQVWEKDLLKSTIGTQDMLTNLLSWSKSQMEGSTVNLSTLNIATALKSTFELSRVLAEKKGITLTGEFPDSLFVVADNDMIQLIVRNLLNNSIKFTKPGGNILLKVEAHDNTCLIKVQDNGIGMEQAQQRDVFSLKAKTTSGTGQEKGVGLGLVLCREFADLQNGEIWFESAWGKGTTFYLRLPIAGVK